MNETPKEQMRKAKEIEERMRQEREREIEKIRKEKEDALKQAMQPPKFTPEQRKERIEEIKREYKPYKVRVEDEEELERKRMKIAWTIAITFAVLTLGFLYLTYNGYLTPELFCSSNQTCEEQVCNCNLTSICNVTQNCTNICNFPDEIKIEIKNMS